MFWFTQNDFFVCFSFQQEKTKNCHFTLTWNKSCLGFLWFACGTEKSSIHPAVVGWGGCNFFYQARRHMLICRKHRVLTYSPIPELPSIISLVGELAEKPLHEFWKEPESGHTIFTLRYPMAMGFLLCVCIYVSVRIWLIIWTSDNIWSYKYNQFLWAQNTISEHTHVVSCICFKISV